MISEFFPLRSSFAAQTHPTQICGRCLAWTVDTSHLPPLENIYNEEYFKGGEYLDYASAKRSQLKNFSKKVTIINALSRMNPEQDSVLEIGCATGEFIELLRTQGFKNLMGVEAANYARSMALKKNLKVLSPFSEHYREEIVRQKPNYIFAWDLWEHLENPARTFDELIDCASPEVTIALSTVDSGQWVPQKRKEKWRQFHPPSHLNYPNRNSFRIYFESRGFEILYLKSFGMYRPLKEYLASVLSRWRLHIAKLPGSFLLNLPVYLNLFDIQLVVAKRKKSSLA